MSTNQQLINIGSQPNDGTGDSIYTAFQKVNQNFTDVYNLLGFGASFSFLRLKEAPTSLQPNALLGVNQFGTKILNKTLIAGTGMNIIVNSTSISIINTASSISTDRRPTLAGDLNAQSLYNLVNIDPNAPYADYDATSRRWVYENFVARDGYQITGTNIASSSTLRQNIHLLKSPTSSTHIVNRAYADTKIGLAGISTIDTFTGLANPTLGTMTGALYLFRDPIEGDHPNQAATKHYVDSSSFISPVNFYVSTNGDDAQFSIPVYKRGRGPSYAFKTINRAGVAAEQFINSSQIILGPYKKTITTNETRNVPVIDSTASSPILDPTLLGQRITLIGVGSNGTDPYQNRSLFPGQYIIGDRSEAVAKVESITVTVGGNEIYDVVPVDYARSWNVTITPQSVSTVTTFTLDPSDCIETPDFWVGYQFKVTNSIGNILSYGLITAVGETIDGSNNCVNYFTVDFTTGVGLGNGSAIAGDRWHVFSADFEVGESLQFGQRQVRNQSTIVLESGEHEDQLPIKLNDNVSIRGDEFRRSIVRPGVVTGTRLPSISSSRWANVYFFRDTQTDHILTCQLNTGTDVKTAGSTIVIDSLTNDTVTDVITVTLKDSGGSPLTASSGFVGKVLVLGGSYKGNGVITAVNADTFSVTLAQNSNYNVQIENYIPGTTIAAADWHIYAPINYGYHYLRDASRPVNLLTTVTNAGGFNNAADLLEDNKVLMQTAAIGWLNTSYPLLSYSQPNFYRDIGVVLEEIVKDLRRGGNHYTINAGDSYNTMDLVTPTQLPATTATINFLNIIGQQILNSTPVTNATTITQVFATTTVEAGSKPVLADLIKACARIVNNDPAFNPPKYNDQMDMFLMNDSTILRYVSGQGHGGFMKVLDPAGQILAKSPYTQTASSFSKSYNRQVFSGGMLVDGFSGNLVTSPATISLDGSGYPTKINVTSQGGLGRPAITTSTTELYLRPQTPCFFVHRGVSYEVDFISEWDPVNGTGGLNLNPARPGGISSISTASGNIASGFRTGATRTIPVRFSNPTEPGGLASTGTATLNASGQVTAVTVSFPGSGYTNGTYSYGNTNAPKIIIGGARLSWTISNTGSITNYTIIDGGQGYAVGTVINFPQQGNGTAATGVVATVDGDGAITAVTISTGGSGYTTDPTVTFGVGLTYSSVIKPGFVATAGHPLPTSVTLITAGNRSMLANDYTQMNDLGYGIFVTNGGFMENVSMFTYYCHSSYYALNGAQVRTITGSSAYGLYGLTSQGSDPTEVPIPVRNKYAMTQLGSVNSSGTYTNKTDDATIYVDGLSYPPLSQSQIEINHNGIWKNYNIKSSTQDSITSGVYNLSIDDGSGAGLLEAVADNTEVIIRQYYDQTLMDLNASTLSRPSTVLTYEEDPTYVYRILSYTSQGGDTALAEGDTPYNYILLTPYSTGGQYRQGLGNINVTNSGTGYTPSSTVTAVIPAPSAATRTATVNGNQTDTDLVNITGASGTVHIGTRITIGGSDPGGVPTYVVWVNSAQTKIRVSESTNWTNSDTLTFTNIQASGYGVTNASGNITHVVLTEAGVGYDSTTPQSITFVSGVGAATAYVTGISGVRTIKVADLKPADQGRITAGTTYTLGWEGDIYKITGYRTTAETGNAWGEVDIERLSDGAALQAEIALNTLKAGITGNQVGGITVKISTLRATSHDMVDIGTGGYADSKIPNDLYGPPLNSPDSAKEVRELGKGRVYYVTTDQDGNFKVGKFFGVDQGRGTVSISAPISLTNVDGISFKRGQTLVNVFSVDGTMGNESNNSVPTEKAITTYVDSRLGLNKNNTTAGITPIGSGFLDLGGVRSMAADLNVNNYKIKNLATPVIAADGVNKSYADTKLSKLGVNDTIGSAAGTLTGPVWTNEFRPNTDNVFWVGTATHRYAEMHAIRFYGTASTSLQWATPRTITLNGDLSGSVNIDGSTNVILTATLNANSIALGTDTTGDYIATGAVSGNGLSGSASGETSTFTVTSNATSSNTANTIVFRDASGNFSAGTITAIATQAQYADVAEKYLPDADYEPGTVLIFGGDKEVTIARAMNDNRIAGVVSTAPAYKMNSELDGGVYVALLGRVPCKVVGKIRKGDMLIASGAPGVATSTNAPTLGAIIGKALENYDSNTVGIIEVVVGRI